MRIIAGSAKGTMLVSPPDDTIRPTLDRVREAFFSIVGPRIAGSRFLDLFAGTGANGLEALSRGAVHADFVDSRRTARAIIEANIKRTKLGDRARVHALTLPAGLSRLKPVTPYDFVYADPPHEFAAQTALFAAIESAQVAAPDGVVVLEHATRDVIPESFGRFCKVRTATYGETTLSFFRSPSDAESSRESDS